MYGIWIRIRGVILLLPPPASKTCTGAVLQFRLIRFCRLSKHLLFWGLEADIYNVVHFIYRVSRGECSLR